VDHQPHANSLDCCCEVCFLPPDLLWKSNARLIRAQYPDYIIGNSRTVRYLPLEALKNGKALLDIYEEEEDRISRLYCDLFQVWNMYSDRARASAFARKYYDAKTISAGADGIDAVKMLPFVRDPSKHDNLALGLRKIWKTAVDQVLKRVDEESSEKWLWRQGEKDNLLYGTEQIY
jgi:hypothetical protein